MSTLIDEGRAGAFEAFIAQPPDLDLSQQFFQEPGYEPPGPARLRKGGIDGGRIFITARRDDRPESSGQEQRDFFERIRRFRRTALRVRRAGGLRWAGIRTRVISAVRTEEEQAELFRTRRGRRRPVARPGHSLHERGLAMDIVPVLPRGPRYTVAQQVLGRLSERFGLTWSPNDPEHFGYAFGDATDRASQVMRLPSPRFARGGGGGPTFTSSGPVQPSGVAPPPGVEPEPPPPPPPADTLPL